MQQLRATTLRWIQRARILAGPIGLAPIGFLIMIALLVHVLMMPFSHASDTAPGQAGRTTSINFDEELIEGMNQRPLDSLTQLSEKKRRGVNSHLYSKKRNFRQETRETLFELPMAQ